MLRIVAYIFFFTIGIVSAGAYFYQLHPQHSIDRDLPRMRQDVDNALERGRRLKDAWHDVPKEEAAANE